jgi:hypothetical protein
MKLIGLRVGSGVGELCSRFGNYRWRLPSWRALSLLYQGTQQPGSEPNTVSKKIW